MPPPPSVSSVRLWKLHLSCCLGPLICRVTLDLREYCEAALRGSEIKLIKSSKPGVHREKRGLRTNYLNKMHPEKKKGKKTGVWKASSRRGEVKCYWLHPLQEKISELNSPITQLTWKYKAWKQPKGKNITEYPRLTYLKVEGKLLHPSSCSPQIPAPRLSAAKKLQRKTEKKKKAEITFTSSCPRKKQESSYSTILPSKMSYSNIHVPEISSHALPVTATGPDAELQQEPWLFSSCATLPLQQSRVRGSHCVPHTCARTKPHRKRCLPQSISLHKPLYSPQE